MRLSCFFALFSLLTACAKPGNGPVAFELYVDNTGAAQSYQQGMSVLQGTVLSGGVDLTYRTSDGAGENTGHVVLRGAEQKRCLTLLNRTELQQDSAAGGANTALEMTLTDAHGRQRTGRPRNADEWTAFAREIGRMRQASEAVGM